MVDIYIQGPRRVEVKFACRPAELTMAIIQPEVLAALTEEELRKIAEHVDAELQGRSQR